MAALGVSVHKDLGIIHSYQQTHAWPLATGPVLCWGLEYEWKSAITVPLCLVRNDPLSEQLCAAWRGQDGVNRAGAPSQGEWGWKRERLRPGRGFPSHSGESLRVWQLGASLQELIREAGSGTDAKAGPWVPDRGGRGLWAKKTMGLAGSPSPSHFYI